MAQCCENTDSTFANDRARVQIKKQRSATHSDNESSPKGGRNRSNSPGSWRPDAMSSQQVTRSPEHPRWKAAKPQSSAGCRNFVAIKVFKWFPAKLRILSDQQIMKFRESLQRRAAPQERSSEDVFSETSSRMSISASETVYV